MGTTTTFINPPKRPGTYDCAACLDSGWRLSSPQEGRKLCSCDAGIEAGNLPHDEPEKALSTPDIMEAAAQTFRERNAKYKDNKDNVGGVMLALFPDGMVLKTKEDYIKWHLFELMVVKMTRYANSGMTHKDSIHDLGIYAFMVEKETA